jgi:steroid 5-alpha reductase family enzyme
MDWQVYLIALAVILGVSVTGWLLSVVTRNVAFVDSLWSMFFLIAALTFFMHAGLPSARGMLVTVLVSVWALRLSIYITARNWGKPEDYRYQAIRANNEPGFVFKSLYIVFGLQGLLAWFIAMPLLPAIMVPGGIGVLEIFATGLWLLGFSFESIGDYQLAKFKRNASNKGRVLDSGLWRYTRHPNYFGDFCIWWAFYLFAFAAGGWWTVLSPLLMSFLLLKVSGVAMLEKTIGERRPDYASYIRRTNAFFPGAPRPAVSSAGELS